MKVGSRLFILAALGTLWYEAELSWELLLALFCAGALLNTLTRQARPRVQPFPRSNHAIRRANGGERRQE